MSNGAADFNGGAAKKVRIISPTTKNVSIAQRLISRKCLIFIAIVIFVFILARHKSHESEAIHASSMYYSSFMHGCYKALSTIAANYISI